MNIKTFRTTLAAGVLLLFGSSAPADTQVSVGIELPHVSIGINVPQYPQFERVPGYPVYYTPSVNANYFFYDGMYWVYQGDNWYASSWYNGPWGLVAPEVMPAYLLRVPVRYYRRPPRYFHNWQADAPPHWGEHWGNQWEQRRRGWDQWNHTPTRRPAPLPVYQREYSGDRYPPVDKQGVLQSEHYPYRPKTKVVRQHYEAVQGHGAPAAPGQGKSQGSGDHPQQGQQAAPPAQGRSQGSQDHPQQGQQAAPPGSGAPQRGNSGHGSDRQGSDNQND
jgi:hypothetical protein